MLFFFFCSIVVLAAAAIVYVKLRYYRYWHRRGITVDPYGSIPFGCLGPIVKNQLSMGAVMYDIYRKNEGVPYVGINLLYRPALLMRDLDLTRAVLAQDFISFHDRGVYVDERNDPLSANIFTMEGKSWRTMRTKLAPCFSSGKLKNMFSVSEAVGERMVEHLRSLVPPGEKPTELDLKEIVTDFSTDIVASVIFGLELNSFKNPTNAFRSIVTESRKFPRVAAIFGMISFLCAPLMKLLIRIGFGQNEMALKLRDIMADTIAYRENHNVVRKDMLQLLMQLRHSGEIHEGDNDWNVVKAKAGLESLSMDAIASQGFIFYIAGQETTAMTAGLTIYELAQYPEILKKAQAEVDKVLAANNGQVTYDGLKAMEFLELCIMEANRKYPGLAMLNRECTRDYPLPNGKDVIKKGTPIIISLQGLHWDPEYFPEPQVFKPERFLPENAHMCNKNAYMPFGEGPRHCIAQRMGRINAKLAVVKILHAFNLEPLPLKQFIEMEPHTIGIIPKGGIKVKFTQRKH